MTPEARNIQIDDGGSTMFWLRDPGREEGEYLSVGLAQSLAEYLLRDQKDKQGRPLIEHVRRVYNSCQSLSLEQRLAAILHDVIEDGMTLSRHPDQDYKTYIQSIACYPDAILIKLADLNDNLDERRGPIPDSLRDRYQKAKEHLESAAIAHGIHHEHESGTRS